MFFSFAERGKQDIHYCTLFGCDNGDSSNAYPGFPYGTFTSKNLKKNADVCPSGMTPMRRIYTGKTKKICVNPQNLRESVFSFFQCAVENPSLDFRYQIAHTDQAGFDNFRIQTSQAQFFACR